MIISYRRLNIGKCLEREKIYIKKEGLEGTLLDSTKEFSSFEAGSFLYKQ